MNYLQRNRSRGIYVKRILIVLVVFAVLATGFYLFGDSLVRIVSPLWKGENALSRTLAKGAGYFSSKNSLIEENTILQEKLFNLEAELINLKASQVIQENIFSLANRPEPTEGVIASVLTHPPQTPYDYLVIDAGERESVRAQEGVYLPEGSLIGRVEESLARSSTIKLFSAVGEETNAVLERHLVPVVLVGKGAGNFKIIVPRDTEVEVGDRILSSDLASSLLAVVQEIDSKPTESFKEVSAIGPTNIFTIRFVIVKP